MKPLSAQLGDLAARAKQAEDSVSAAGAHDRAALEAERDRLHTKIAATQAATLANLDQVKTDTQSWWDESRATLNDKLVALRARRDEHRAERDLKKAINRADDAEYDAADAIDYASYAIDQAEYAVIDAVIARAEAQDLAAEHN